MMITQKEKKNRINNDDYPEGKKKKEKGK